MVLIPNAVHGQIMNSEFITCTIMANDWGKSGLQVVLETNENCNIELWVKAVNYYKSLGYIETSYSNFLGDNPIITLTKVP